METVQLGKENVKQDLTECILFEYSLLLFRHT